MKKYLLLIALSTYPQLLDAQTLQEPHRFGLGVILGEPLGPNAKYFLTKEQAIDVGLAYSFEEFFMTYGDYIFHFPGTFKNDVPELGPLTPYVGVGGGIRFSAKNKPDPGDRRSYFFVRSPLGLEWIFDRVPIGVGLEIAPALSLAPKTFFLFQGGLTARYYF